MPSIFSFQARVDVTTDKTTQRVMTSIELFNSDVEYGKSLFYEILLYVRYKQFPRTVSVLGR